MQDRLARRITLSGVVPRHRPRAARARAGRRHLRARPRARLHARQGVRHRHAHLPARSRVPGRARAERRRQRRPPLPVQLDVGVPRLQQALGNYRRSRRCSACPTARASSSRSASSVAWDRRDNAFNAHRGTYVFLGGELVNSFPEGAAVKPNTSGVERASVRRRQTSQEAAPRAAGRGALRAADADLRRLHPDLQERVVRRRAAPRRERQDGGVPVHDTVDPANPPPPYCTYPDRLFFMGGFDSMRGLAARHVHAAGVRRTRSRANPALCLSSSTNCLIPLRGGNLMINPRVELRFPIRAPAQRRALRRLRQPVPRSRLHLRAPASRCGRTWAPACASTRRSGRSSSTTASTSRADRTRTSARFTSRSASSDSVRVGATARRPAFSHACFAPAAHVAS